MKKVLLISFLIFNFSFLILNSSTAQCSVCSKTAAQMGEKPAKALNSAILYLMMAPFAIAGVVGYRWWKSNRGES